MQWGKGRQQRSKTSQSLLLRTQSALQAIRNNDKDESTVLLDLFNPQSMLQDLQDDQIRLSQHRIILSGVQISTQVQKHSPQGYCLQMGNNVFPIKIYLKNVKNQGTIFVGYDQMWPHKKKDNKDECDYSANVCKEMMIVLNNKKRKVVKKIYVVFMTEMEMLMLSFRVDFVYNCKFNVPMLESKEEKDEKMDKVGSGKKSIIKRNVITNRNLSALGNLLGSKSVRKLSVLDKDFQNIKKLNKSRKKLQSNIRQHSEPAKTKSQQIKGNQQAIQIYKVKDKALRALAKKCKVLIEAEQKRFHQGNTKMQKHFKIMTCLVLTTLFISSTNDRYHVHLRTIQTRAKSIYFGVRMDSLCRKFTKKVKQSLAGTIRCIPSRINPQRLCLQHCISLTGRLIQGHCMNKATDILYKAFTYIHPALLFQQASANAIDYRAKVRLIQRHWLSKCTARKTMLLKFTSEHVQQLLKIYPHFKIFISQWQSMKMARKICAEYVNDENAKFEMIYQTYCKRLKEIKELTRMSQVIEGQVKEKRKVSESREKRMMTPEHLGYPSRIHQKPSKGAKLSIPKQPVRPMHRFFRSLDILKAMVRFWFQLQYKKWMKKCIDK